MEQKPKSENEWVTPQLILLGRGNPEEHVLGKCQDSLPTGEWLFVHEGS